MTELDRLKKMPPYAARLLAHEKHKWEHMTCEQIAKKSGMSADAIKVISRKNDWMTVPTETRLRFLAACGIDMSHLRRHLELIKRTNGLRNARHLRFALSPVNNTHYKFYARLVAKMPTFV